MIVMNRWFAELMVDTVPTNNEKNREKWKKKRAKHKIINDRFFIFYYFSLTVASLYIQQQQITGGA